ncbi:MAG: TIGR02597 family protein [Planctomycetes bacterium]|nr:TIGR02597 family protein [Planctomycetota bacterium]
MKIKVSAIIALALLALTVTAAYAEGIVGYNRIQVPANSDVKLIVPFNQNAEDEFAVNTVTGSGVTVTDTLQAGAYAGAYYVRFTSGNGEGLWSTISNNGVNDFTIDANVLPYINPGDTFRVYMHHTLGSIFPKSLYGVSFTNGTQLFIYENNIAAMTKNKSSSKAAVYTTSGGGRWVGAGVSNNTILVPETQFILRNNSASTFTVFLMGEVPDYSVSMLIAADGDLVIGSGYPLPVVLKDAGLEGNQRQVYFYDNSATGINKSAVKVAAYTTSGGGRWVGAGITGNELINPSEVITLRLPATEAGTKVTVTKPY